LAWTSIPSFTAGNVLTASQLNTYVRANLNALLPLDVIAGTAYTPVLTQSTSVTKSVTRAQWCRIGNIAIAWFYLVITGTGTANNKVTVSLPTTAASAAGLEVGSGHIFDSSASSVWHCNIRMDSTTTVAFYNGTNGIALGATSSPFTAAYASGDEATGHVIYEAA
jgi:hypothetical protein